MHVAEIWSGGQTGVDRAALDVAMNAGLPARGWIPRGRLAEDGTVPARYRELREASSEDYAMRTTLNVQDTDATLILYRYALTGGSAFTLAEAQRLGRPCLALDLGAQTPAEAVVIARKWLEPLRGTRLNVAGPRAGTDHDVAELAAQVLRALLEVAE